MSVLVIFLPTKKLFAETKICSLTNRVEMGGATFIREYLAYKCFHTTVD